MAAPLAILALAEALTTASATGTPRPAYKNSRLLAALKLIIERAGNTGGGTIYGASLNGPSGYANAAGDYGIFQGDGSTLTFDLATLVYAALANNNLLVRVSKSGRTGTAAVTAASTTVTGTSTAFTTELNVGDEIQINGETRTVIAIASTTVLTVDKAFVNTASGASIYLIDGFLVPTTDFTVSNPSGSATRITIGAAAKVPSGCKIEVSKVTPVALFSFATATLTFKQVEVPAGGYDALWYVSDATASPSSTNVYVEALSR
jgi:hypothetical protein